MKITNKLQRLFVWWENLRLVPFMGVTLLFSYVVFIFFIPFSFLLPPMASSGEIHFFKIIESIVIAPVIETLIWQAGVIYLLERFITKKITFQVAISSVLFGLSHYYNITYIFFGIYLGIVLSTAFVLYKRKNSWSEAYGTVVLIHVFRNIIAISIKVLFP
jgi:hypothetical protein